MTDANGRRHPFLDQLGKPLIATLDRTTLENVARLTDGKTFYASDSDSLDSVFSTLADLERRPAKTEDVVSRRAFVWPFVALLALSCVSALFALAVLARSSSIRSVERTYSVRGRARLARLAAAGLSTVVIVAMASPWVFGFAAGGADSGPIVWIVDVSKSMDARDMPDGKSRLERAKELVANTMEEYRGTEQGLVVFAGDSVIASPLTRDTDTLLGFVAGLDTSAVSRGGTDIAGALGAASGLSVEGRQPVAVVLTDGGDPGDADPQTLRRSLDRTPHTLFVGLGSREGAPIPVGKDPFGSTVYAQYEGARVVTKLNSSLLSGLPDYEENPDEVTPPRGSEADRSAGSPDWSAERVALAWCLLPLWLATIFIPDTRRYE